MPLPPSVVWLGEVMGEIRHASQAVDIIDGCRELTGNWFSPRGAVGTKRDQYLISEDFGEGRRWRWRASAKISELSSSPPRLLRFRPRWRRGRDTQPNGQLAREETRVGSCRGPPATPLARSERNSFLCPTTTPTSSHWGLALAGRTRPQGACFPPYGS